MLIVACRAATDLCRKTGQVLALKKYNLGKHLLLGHIYEYSQIQFTLSNSLMSLMSVFLQNKNCPQPTTRAERIALNLQSKLYKALCPGFNPTTSPNETQRTETRVGNLATVAGPTAVEQHSDAKTRRC